MAPSPAYEHAGVALYQGDCRDVLRELPLESVDALVTDPPAGIAFMGREWDHDHGGRAGWVDAFAALFAGCFRVLRPGAHGLVWALPRTSHWTATALEDAGFEVRDVITHHFGSGFPKSLDVAKAIDKAARGVPQGGADPTSPNHGKFRTQVTEGVRCEGDAGRGYGAGPGQFMRAKGERDERMVVDAARPWQGWGTALKPATEHWILVRKPLAEGTVAANVLAHGTGALNVDGCRVSASGPSPAAARRQGAANHCRPGEYREGEGRFTDRRSPETFREERPGEQLGRWPANLVLSHAEDCREVGTKRVPSDGHHPAHRGAAGLWSGDGGGLNGTEGGERYSADTDGMETVPAWECAPGCPVAELDQQSGDAGVCAPVRGTEPTKDGFSGAVYGVGMTRRGGGGRSMRTPAGHRGSSTSRSRAGRSGTPRASSRTATRRSRAWT